MPMKRRDFMKTAGLAGAGLVLLPGFSRRGLYAAPQAVGLSDPATQPKFLNLVPDAMAPGFKFSPRGKKNKIKVSAGPSIQNTGLLSPGALGDPARTPVMTPVWGYGTPSRGYTWPGMTFEVQSGVPLEVTWENRLVDPVTGAFVPHPLPVDTSLHWCYSLPGYTQHTLASAGVPIVSHLHGGHTDFQFDGNPEFFFSPGWGVLGPQWVEKKYMYLNDQPAGNLWYHDHALGITRLNVYAGLAGFYFVRDANDTGLPGNTQNLPAWPYEKAYAIQDRMFRDTGELFYSAYPGDPFYDDFITGEGVVLPPEFINGGPTALAEFFGDHMVVNGVIWPKEEVEPRKYRMHLLNGTDSRFMVLQLFEVPAVATDFSAAIKPVPFTVIGSDQGLAGSPNDVDTLVSEPGSRYDIIVDFSTVAFGNRVIMKNIGGDAPFGGDYGDALAPEDFFTDRQTDRIMAFDVNQPLSAVPEVGEAVLLGYSENNNAVDRIRKVALFEGKDEIGRLQPLLGTAEPATDFAGNPINWPNTPVYSSIGLIGPMEGSIAWHSPTTENPALNSTEEWEVWNVTGDAHPVHLHLVHFDVLGRRKIVWDSETNDEDRVLDPALPAGAGGPAGDGTYLVGQPTVQHNSVAGDPTTYGMGFKIMTPMSEPFGADELDLTGYVENTPKDMVTALPDQVTVIKATFDKPGRYVWHCHILSHEDHEMMRVMHVGQIPTTAAMAMAKKGSLKSAELESAELNAPLTFELQQNYPNPFNPSTTIDFSIPSDERVRMDIYSSTGRLVRSLVNQSYTAGRHSVKWNGKNNWGRQVASGMYIYRIKAGKYVKTMKMRLLR
jgi:spore coat protein A, manganese oxidase